MDLDFDREIILENDRALLRPLALTDFDRLQPVAAEDKDLLRFSPAPVHTPELLSRYIDTCLKERQSGLRYPFLIFDKKLNACAGCTSYLSISSKDLRLEIGSTWIGNGFQRTGLNRNCKFLLLSYAFEQLRFARVELKTDERNTRSRSAIVGIGARQEGILRSHTLMPDGFRRNTMYFSILADEWPAVKRDFRL